MATIESDFGTGGSVVLTGTETGLSMSDVLKDVALDLEDLRAALGAPASISLVDTDVPVDLGGAGRGLSSEEGHGSPTYKELFDKAADDLDDLNTTNALGLTLNHTASNTPSDLGSGGVGMTPESERSFKDILFDISDDLQAIVDTATAASITTTVDLTGGIDLSVNFNVKIEIDNGGAVEIDLSAGAAVPGAVTRDEIIANLEAALGSSVIISTVDIGGEFIKIETVAKGTVAEIEFTAPSGNDATDAAFGVTFGATATYPNTFNGTGADFSSVVLRTVKG